MSKQFWPLLLASWLICMGWGDWSPASAQTPPAETTVATVTLAFNPTTDHAATPPTNRGISNQPYDDSRIIIGEDERAPVFTREFPWAAIGRLDWTDGEQVFPQCTATLIGPDLILTNAHCLEILTVPDPDTDEDVVFVDAQQYASITPKLVFKPGLINGIALDQATVESFETGWTVQSQPAAEDWALMKLDQPLGAAEQYGHLGWLDLDFTNPDVLDAVTEKIKLAGYAEDFPTEPLQAEFGDAGDTAGVDLACSVLGVVADGDYIYQLSRSALADTLVHDCDTSLGASGGPIFALLDDNNFYIVGLHARAISLGGATATLSNGLVTEVLNGGVLVSRWADSARTLLNESDVTSGSSL